MVDASAIHKASKRKLGPFLTAAERRKKNNAKIAAKVAAARERNARNEEVAPAERDANGKLRLKWKGCYIQQDKNGKRFIQPRNSAGHFGKREYI